MAALSRTHGGVASLMDVTVLVVASLLVWLLVNRENHYA